MEQANDTAGSADDVNLVLNSWVSAQLDSWETRRYGRQKSAEYFDWLNDARKDVFVFVIRDRDVQILPKPKFYTLEEMQHGSHEHIKRALLYRQFFVDVVREYCPELSCRLAMTTDDMAMEPTGLPLFSFQKKQGSRAVLLPDIDALLYQFYAGYADDGVAYDRKINRAVFVGSTTGEVHTQKSVAARSNERLRLGVFFRDNPNVVFNLPNITQCDSPATESDIRVLGFGTGSLSWPQQLEYRFLISVDGNGATCSRVAIALKSNSVLLKFNSPHRLYYFDALEAHTHFIPIADPQEMQAILDAEGASPGLHAPIAAAATEFYETYLTRAASLAYTAMLLERYADLFDDAAQHLGSGDGATQAPNRFMPSAPSDVRARCVAHIRDRGDVAFDLDSWIGDADGQAVLEGFQIEFQAGIDQGLLSCRILTGKNEPWQQQRNDAFVGSRSLANSILGLAFELADEPARKYDCLYVCSFVNGTTSTVHRNGERCSADETYPIKAFKIAFPRKAGIAA